MYERARKLGIRTVGIDYNPHAPAFEYCDMPLIVSVKHVEQLLPALDKLSTEITFLGVMTLGVEISPMVSLVAKRYGLIAVSEATAALTTNKCLRNMRLGNVDNVTIPKFQVLRDYTKIDSKYMSLPFVVKPSDSSASRGVRRVDRKEDIEDAFNDALKYSTDGRVLIEELLHGPEISIEGFMVDGTMYVTGFADRNYATIPNTTDQPYFIEDGSHLPSTLPEDIVEQACRVFERAALALGITDGPSKGDLMVVGNKVYVIEITSRLSGGGFCSRGQAMQNGTDIVTATIQWHCGMEVYKDLLIPKYNRAVCHRFYFHKPGEIKFIHGIPEIESMPGVTHYVEQYPFKVGDVLEPASYINRLFYVLTVADDIPTAVRYAEDAINSVSIITA